MTNIYGDYQGLTSGSNEYPVIRWRKLAYDNDLEGSYLLIGGSAGLALERIGLELSAFGQLRISAFTGSGQEEQTLYLPYRTGASSPTQFVESVDPVPVSLDSRRTELEAGASAGLVFLKRALSLRGTPRFDISYVRTANTTRTLITDSMTSLSQVEGLDYVKFSLRLGL